MRFLPPPLGEGRGGGLCVGPAPIPAFPHRGKEPVRNRNSFTPMIKTPYRIGHARLKTTPPNAGALPSRRY